MSSTKGVARVVIPCFSGAQSGAITVLQNTQGMSVNTLSVYSVIKKLVRNETHDCTAETQQDGNKTILWSCCFCRPDQMGRIPEELLGLPVAVSTADRRRHVTVVLRNVSGHHVKLWNITLWFPVELLNTVSGNKETLNRPPLSAPTILSSV